MKQNRLFLKIMAALLVFSSYLTAQNKPVLQSRVITDKAAIDQLVERVIKAMNAEGAKIGLFIHAVNAKQKDPRESLLAGYGDTGFVDIGAKDFFIEHFEKYPPSTYKEYKWEGVKEKGFFYDGHLTVYGEENKFLISFSKNELGILQVDKKRKLPSLKTGFLVAPKLQQTLLKMCMYLQEAEIQGDAKDWRKWGISEEEIQKGIQENRKAYGLLDIKLEPEVPESGKPEVDDQPEKEEGGKSPRPPINRIQQAENKGDFEEQESTAQKTKPKCIPKSEETVTQDSQPKNNPWIWLGGIVAILGLGLIWRTWSRK